MTSEYQAFSNRKNGAARGLRAIMAAATGAALAIASPALAAQGYNESSGDLSNDPAAPTPVTIGLGDNFISGTTGRATGTDPIDADYFTFSLGADEVLDSILVLDGTTTHGVSFIGIDSGSQFTLVGPGATGILGWMHYDDSVVGTNILDDMSVPNMGSSGFGTLGAGTYSVWIQEASPGDLVSYNFNFLVREVPEASTWAMMIAGFGLMGLAFRRNRKARNPLPAIA